MAPRHRRYRRHQRQRSRLQTLPHRRQRVRDDAADRLPPGSDRSRLAHGPPNPRLTPLGAGTAIFVGRPGLDAGRQLQMLFGSSTFLGVSLRDRSLSCAEIAVTGGKRIVRRLATFTLPQELSFDKPDALGAALAAFLRQNKFSASRAVVGIPAKWLIALEKEIPPAPEEQGRAMLRLQAERLAVSDSGEMVFDYAGRIESDKPNKVLLVGVLRQRIDQIEKMFEAARIAGAAGASS